MEDCGQGPDRDVEEEGIRETVLHGLRSEGRAHSGHDVSLQSRSFHLFCERRFRRRICLLARLWSVATVVAVAALAEMEASE